MLFSSVTTLTGALAVAFAAPTREVVRRQDVSAPHLHTAAVAAGKLWFGSAIDTTSAEVSDTKYMTIFNSSIFGATTPGNTMKWYSVEPTQNDFNFAPGMETVNLAQQTGKKLRCHNLVWHSQLPSWVTSGTWTNATLLAAMQNHITKVIEGFGSACYSWDVVNEALNDDGTYESNVFLTNIGEAYVPLAFLYATQAIKAADLDIKLVYNDYNIEYPGTKATAAANIVQQIKAYGAQIDVMGFESHFIVGETPNTASQMSAMSTFTELGLEIHQTEIDIRHTSLPPSAAALQQQSTDYYNTVAACMKTNGCTGMTVWDFDDAYSWIPSTFSGQGDADLYWANYTRKSAYTAVYQAIQNASCTVC